MNLWKFPVLLTAVFFAGCAMLCDTLEFDQTSRTRVYFADYQEGTALHVEGMTGKPGIMVEEIRQIKEGNTIHIEVLVSSFERPECGPEFSTDVFLDGIDVITFGKKQTILWRRYPEKKSLPSKPKPVFIKEN